MRLVDLSMTVEECDAAPFAQDEYYFKITPIVRWEDKGFVSNCVEMTVHAGTHIDSPHHFFRDKPGIEARGPGHPDHPRWHAAPAHRLAEGARHHGPEVVG